MVFLNNNARLYDSLGLRLNSASNNIYFFSLKGRQGGVSNANRRQRTHLQFIDRSFQESDVRYFTANSSRITHIEACFEVKIWQNHI